MQKITIFAAWDEKLSIMDKNYPLKSKNRTIKRTRNKP